MLTKIKFYIKFWLKSLFVLPGTTMHELMHFLIAVLTLSKITSFNLIPKVKWENSVPEVIYGSVGYISRLKLFDIPINLAPLLLIPLSWLILHYFGYVNIPKHFNDIQFNYKPIFTIKGAIAALFVIEMLWASLPSSQDLKNVANGFMSISFLVFILILVAAYFEQDWVIQKIEFAKNYYYDFIQNVNIPKSLHL